MKTGDIERMLSETGIKYSYHHFEERDAIEPPFLIWNLPKSNNFIADGKVYQQICQLDIELYTDQKDWSLEKKIEESLMRYDIVWKKTEGYLEDESMYETLYEMEVMINE